MSSSDLLNFAKRMRQDFAEAQEALTTCRFKVGDVVRLKSGGQWMTVMGYSPQPVFTKMDVVCDWHNVAGDYQHNYYREDQLEKVDIDTIERCAQRVEMFLQGPLGKQAAGVIRQLKEDKP